MDDHKLLERVAQLTAHRACCGTEHDPANGKLHGYCVVCGVPWPCEYAGSPPLAGSESRKAAAFDELFEAARVALHDMDHLLSPTLGPRDVREEGALEAVRVGLSAAIESAEKAVEAPRGPKEGA